MSKVLEVSIINRERRDQEINPDKYLTTLNMGAEWECKPQKGVLLEYTLKAWGHGYDSVFVCFG